MLESPHRWRTLIVATSVVVIAVPIMYVEARPRTSGSPQQGPYVSDGFYSETKQVPHWLIAMTRTPGPAAHTDSGSAMNEGPRPASSGEGARLGVRWLFFPISLLSLAVLVPIGIGTTALIRNRRAAASYRAL
jgi:hypothetical protein